MRSFDRSATSLRPLSIELGVMKFAEGSALITLGDTRC
jgi:exosome complex RNA-binding protein Rrp42 (RNase PH superfamily)